MDNATVDRLARKAGVRIMGSWIEGHPDAIYRFAEAVVEHIESEPTKIAWWPDGFWCELDELSQYSHRSDDYQTLDIYDWDDDGEPMLPGGLR